MKQSLFILFLFMGPLLFGQVSVTVKPSDTIICYRDSVAFEAVVTGTFTGKLSYRWQKNFADLSAATDSLLVIRSATLTDAALYRCIILVDGLETDTSNDAILRMHPRMYIDTLYRYNPLGCYADCKGQFKGLVSGGTPFSNYPPYIYEWGGGFSEDTLVFGLCPGTYRLRVTDSLGCILDSSYLVDALKSPKVDFTFSPRDTVYLTNPVVTVAFPDSMLRYITNWTWEFGDSTSVTKINPASHAYSAAGPMMVKLKYTDLNGCDTVYQHELTVKVAELEIPNVFTPNGDFRNDRFEIRLKGESKTEDFRQAYLANEFQVYDRWGRKVFSQDNYKSEDWDGGNLSDGTYFYILKCTSYWGTDVFRGAVTILR